MKVGALLTKGDLKPGDSVQSDWEDDGEGGSRPVAFRIIRDGMIIATTDGDDFGNFRFVEPTPSQPFSQSSLGNVAGD